MHFEQRRPDNSEERILPLINVVFLLLIFFMIAGSMTVTEPFAVEAPQSASTGETAPEPLSILFAGDGRLALQGEPLSRPELLQRIGQRLSADPETPVQLKADNSAQGNHVVQLLEELHQAGVEKLRLITVAEGQ